MPRGHAEPGQGSSPAANRPTDATHEAAEQYHGRRTRSRHPAGHAASLAAVETQPDDDLDHGRRSARLQVKGEQKQHEDLQQQRELQQQHDRLHQAALSGPGNAVSSRTSRALARNARLAEDNQTAWDWSMPTDQHMSAEEKGQDDLLNESVTAPSARRTRAQSRSSVPEHSRRSTPEPPEQASDVHNTDHALHRSHRQHARSPSVAGPANIDRPEEALQAVSSGIRVTLRTLRRTTRQADNVYPAPSDSEVLPRRHQLRSSLRARQ